MSDKLPTPDELVEMWSKDSDIDSTNLTEESLNTARLHGKYLKLYSKFKFRAIKCGQDYDKMKKLKYRYYGGLMSEAEYKEHGWEPFRDKLIKDNVERHVDGDQQVIDLINKKLYFTELCDLCKFIVEALKNRAWSIKTAVDHKRFEGGA